MKKFKRLLAIILSVILALFALPMCVSAETTYYYGIKMFGDDVGTFTVNLEKALLPEKLELSSEELSVYAGGFSTLGYSVSPADAVSDISVIVADTSIVQSIGIVDGAIEFYGIKEGTTDVTVSTVNGVTETFEVKVSEVPAVALEDGKAVEMSDSDYNGTYHFTFVPEKSGNYVYCSLGDIWQNLCIYDGDEELCFTNGFVKYWVLELEKDKKYDVRIYTGYEHISDWQIVMAEQQDPDSIKIAGGDTTVYVGGSGQFEAVVEPFYSYMEECEWSCSNTYVLEIDPDGNYNAIKAGTATVTIKSGDLSNSITVTVNDGIELSLDKAENGAFTDLVDFNRFVFTPEKTGKYAFYSQGDLTIYAELYNEGGDYMAWDEGSYDGTNFYIECELYAGKKYYLTTESSDYQIGSYTVTVFEKPRVVSASISRLPFTKKYIKGTLEDAFDATGLEVNAALSDGTTETLVINYWDYDFEFEEDDDVGTVYVYLDDVCLEFEVELVDSGIESIEVDPDFSFTLMEGVNAYKLEDDYGDTYYAYEYYFSDDFPITVNFNDGTGKEVTFSDTVNGGYFYYEDDQWYEHWEVGGEYEIALCIYDVVTYIPVYIVENTVTSVKITSSPDKTEYIFGDVNYGLMFNDAYIFAPELVGLEFTVTYSDRESEVIPYSEYLGIDPIFLQAKAAGKITVELEFLGETLSLDIVIKESNVLSIEIVSPPDQPEYSNFAYYVNPIGMSVKITYTDGTSETVTVTKDNMSSISNYWDDVLLIENGDNDISVYCPYFRQDAYVVCNGVIVELDCVEVSESEIKGIKLLDFGDSGDGMVIEVTYINGDTEIINFEVIPTNFHNDDMYGVAITEHGLVNYYVEKYYGIDGKLLYTEVDVLGYTVYLTETEGDCNGDGEVNTTDLAVMKLFLAGAGEIDKSGADLNGDGEVNTTDLAELKLLLAGI